MSVRREGTRAAKVSSPTARYRRHSPNEAGNNTIIEPARHSLHHLTGAILKSRRPQRMKHVIQNTLANLRAAAWVPLTTARVLTGVFFCISGGTKLLAPSHFTELQETMVQSHIPFLNALSQLHPFVTSRRIAVKSKESSMERRAWRATTAGEPCRAAPTPENAGGLNRDRCKSIDCYGLTL